MSTLPPQEVIDAIESGDNIVTRRLEFYESDGSTLWAPGGDIDNRLIDGTVTVDYGRDERRTFDISVDNSDNALRPNAINGLWYDKIIKLFRGIEYTYLGQSLAWETQMGEFMIDKIDEDSFPHITKLAGRDYTKKCMVSKFGQSTTFAEGSNVVQTIKAIAANAGITKFRLPVSTESLGAPVSVDRTQDRWSVMKSMADSFGYEIYFDNLGYLTLRRYLDPSTSPLEWTFETGAKGNLVKWARSTNDTRLYNHIIVTGEGGDVAALPFFGEAENIEPSSPTRVSRIGDRSYFYTSSFFTSDQQCLDLANAWLRVMALESFESSWDSFNYPWMEVGEIVGFLDPKRAVHEPTRYLMDTLSIPMGLGPMSATAKRVTIVGSGRIDVIPKLVVGTYTLPDSNLLFPSSLLTQEAFGNPMIGHRVNLLKVGNIASLEALGNPSTTFGTLIITVVPTGIASAQALGVPNILPITAVTSTGIASVQGFGTPTINTYTIPPIAVSPIGIGSVQGSGTNTWDNAQAWVNGDAWLSATAFGDPTIGQTSGGINVSAAGAISSSQALGNPTVRPIITVSSVGAIASAQAVGTPKISSTVFGWFPGNLSNDPAAAFSTRTSFDTMSTTFGPPGVWRYFYTGMPPTNFVGSVPDYHNTPVVISFKATPTDVSAGMYDSTLIAWWNSIPVDRKVWWSFYHEPEDNINRAEFTSAQYKAAWTHLVSIAPSKAVKPNLRATCILMGYSIAAGRTISDYVIPTGLDVLAWDSYIENYAPTAHQALDMCKPVSDSYGYGFAIAEISVENLMTNPPSRDSVVPDLINTARADKAEFITWFETNKSDGDWRLTPYTSAVATWNSMTH